MALVGLSLLIAVGGDAFGFGILPPGVQVLPLLGGGLLLQRRSMRALVVVVAACLVYDVARYSIDAVRPGALLVVVIGRLAVVQGVDGAAYATAASQDRSMSVPS